MTYSWTALPHCIRLSANITLPNRRHKHYIQLPASFFEGSLQLIVDVCSDLGSMLPPFLLNDSGGETPLSILCLSPLILLGFQKTELIVQFQSFQLYFALLKTSEHALNSDYCFYSFFFQEVFDIGLYENLNFEFLPQEDEQNVSS